MTIAELIEKLEDYKKLYGNIEVKVYCAYDDHSYQCNPKFYIKNFGIRTLLIHGN